MRALKKKIARLCRLRAEDYAATLVAAACLGRAWAGLRVRNLPALMERLGLAHRFAEATTEQVARARQVVRWAHWIVPVRANCLLDSLAAAMWLRRQRLSIPLVIGVRNTQGSVEAHAWLERDEPVPADFRVLWRSSASQP